MDWSMGDGGAPELDPRLLAAIQQAIAAALPSAKVASDVGATLTPVYPPVGAIPEAVRVLAARDLIVSQVMAGGAAPSPPLVIGNEAVLVYGVSGDVRNNTAGIAGNLSDVTIQMVSGATERYQSDPVMLSSWLGADRFRLFGGRGLMFRPNSTVVVNFVNLQAALTLRADLTFQALLLR